MGVLWATSFPLHRLRKKNFNKTEPNLQSSAFASIFVPVINVACPEVWRWRVTARNPHVSPAAEATSLGESPLGESSSFSSSSSPSSSRLLRLRSHDNLIFFLNFIVQVVVHVEQ